MATRKTSEPLTVAKINATKPSEKGVIKLSDTGGLRLMVWPSGVRSWQLRYRWHGREKILTLGHYPDIPLADARLEREKAKAELRAGRDPSVSRNAGSACFDAVSKRWFAKMEGTWTPGHARTVRSRLDRDLRPRLGQRHIAEITAPEVLEALRHVESRGAVESAHRIRQIAGQVFNVAIAEGLRKDNPAAALSKALISPTSKHMPAFTQPDDVRRLMRSIHAYEGTNVVRTALQLAPLVMLRPGELRHGEWSEIDFKNRLWTIPAEKMKRGAAHSVPLSRQAFELLKALHPETGEGRYIFPSPRTGDRPMSNNAILAALRSMGFGKDEMTGHGFRAMARTMIDEQLEVRPDIIEQQLAHVQKDPNGRAYNRTKHLKERREMLQRWADYLDELREGR